MKINELRQKSNEELISLMHEKELRINELHFLLRQNKIKNVKETSAIKKDIARIKTIFSSRKT